MVKLTYTKDVNKKLLWKIELLWEQCVHSDEIKNPNPRVGIECLYQSGISIYNPDFQLVEGFDSAPSVDPAHIDEYGSYKGLASSQVLFSGGKPVYLFDNHNKIIQSFLEYVTVVEQGFDVVHIDAHPDDAVFPAEKPHHLELNNVQQYIQQTRISDFFNFVSEASMIKNIHRYTTSVDFKEFKKPKNPYILSLDIDIFGPEGDFVDIESKIRIIAKAWTGADMVCIATSPGFIDQGFARGIVEIFVKK